MKPEVKYKIGKQEEAYQQIIQLAEESGLKIIVFGVADAYEALENYFEPLASKASVEDLQRVSDKMEIYLSAEVEHCVREVCENYYQKHLKASKEAQEERGGAQ